MIDVGSSTGFKMLVVGVAESDIMFHHETAALERLREAGTDSFGRARTLCVAKPSVEIVSILERMKDFFHAPGGGRMRSE